MAGKKGNRQLKVERRRRGDASDAGVPEGRTHEYDDGKGRALMREVHKRYLREFLPAMAGYVVLIGAFGVFAPRIVSVAGRVALALLPLLPILLAIRAMVRVLRDQDELERRIDLESFAIAAMATGFGFFSFGLVLTADVGWQVHADVVAIWVMPCLFATFGIAKLLIAWRYRQR